MSAPIDFDRAMDDPASVFGAPERVLDAPGLDDEQKARILRRWQYEASEESVAEEEGMSDGQGSDMQRRILLALGRVTGEEQGEHTGPTKQHGI